MASGDPNITPEDVARLKATYGLDRPLHERYLAWLQAALSGDFGHSRLYAVPVLDVLLPRLLNTCALMGISLLLAVLIALPAGILAALKPRTWLDYGINLVAFAGISLPSFWLALLVILLFSVELGWLPASGTRSIGQTGLFDRALHLVLPVLTLTLLTVGGLIRFVRGAMIDVLRQDFVRTARAKGLSVAGVVLGHALRNAMLPVLTLLALQFGTLFSGALVVETIFAYLGMGKLIYDAVMGNDFNLALVGLLFATLVTLLANLAADLGYAWLDPRISYAR
jgi:peptide/nickel transport system permease protein